MRDVRWFLVDVCGEIVINRQKALNFVLIMGDVSGQMDFIRTIRLLRSRGYCNVFLVQEPPNGSGDLGSTDWLRAAYPLEKTLSLKAKPLLALWLAGLAGSLRISSYLYCHCLLLLPRLTNISLTLSLTCF